MKLEVEKELERKLSASQILIEDMEQVIEHCERKTAASSTRRRDIGSGI